MANTFVSPAELSEKAAANPGRTVLSNEGYAILLSEYLNVFMH